MTKLNFGCGDKPIPGYINIDIRSGPQVDVRMAAWEQGPFTQGHADEILARHMLEHMILPDAIRTVANWRWLLKPGGILHVVVPDMAFHARQLLGEAHSATTDPVSNFNHAMAGFYGWHSPHRGGPVEDAHRWGYTETSLTKLLREAGFVEITRCVTGVDSQPWHLNMNCRKPQ